FRGVAPDFRGSAAHLVSQISTEVDKISSGEIADDLVSGMGWNDAQASRVRSFLQQHRSDITGFLQEMERLASTAIAAIFVIPILAIFFLSDGERLAAQVIGMVSTASNYDSIHSLAAELHSMLQHYIRAKVTLGALSLTYSLAGLLLLGFPHPVALA